MYTIDKIEDSCLYKKIEEKSVFSFFIVLAPLFLAAQLLDKYMK